MFNEELMLRRALIIIIVLIISNTIKVGSTDGASNNSAQDLFSYAYLAYESGDYHSALSLVNRSLTMDSAYLPSILLSVFCNDKLGRHEQVRQLFEDSYNKMNTIDKKLVILKAKYTYYTESYPDTELAEATVQQALEVDPTNLYFSEIRVQATIANNITTAQVGEMIPNLSVIDNLGDSFALSNLCGNVTLLVVFATWWSPSISALEQAQLYHHRLSNSGLKVITLSVEGNVEQVNNYLTANDISLPCLIDSGDWESQTIECFKLLSLPAMILLDNRGVVRFIGSPLDLTEEYIVEVMSWEN